MAASSARGPYETAPFPSSGVSPLQALGRLEVSTGDLIELSLRTGRKLEGKYLRVEAATASDTETYVVLDLRIETRLAAPAPGQKQGPVGIARVPTSQIVSVGVDQLGYSWLIGTVVGLAVDIIVVHDIDRQISGEPGWILSR